MELSPRTREAPAPRRRRRRALPLLALGVVLAALGVVVYQGLSDATVYFLNADEAVERRDELGTQRFRLQGTVTGQAEEAGRGASFDVAYDCVTVPVRHVGDPPRMFRPGIPVVLEGRWDGDVFASDSMFVAHDAEYQDEGEYDERIAEAEAGRATDGCPGGAGDGTGSGGDAAAGDGGAGDGEASGG